MTIESTTQQQRRDQEEMDDSVADKESTTPVYFPGTRGLKQKKDKNRQSTASVATTNTDHFQNYDPVVSTGRKSWKHSLKRATSSVLYMAMPPSNAEQLPMVVPETPMSPDKLPSTPLVLRTPVRGPPSLAPSNSTGSSISTKSTKSMDLQSTGSSISQMPPMPALDLSTLQRAHTVSRVLSRESHVNETPKSKEKERKSISEQRITALQTDQPNEGRRTKSFSAAASSSTSSSTPSNLPSMPITTPPKSRERLSGETRGSSTRSSRSSMDNKPSATFTTSHSASKHPPPSSSVQQRSESSQAQQLSPPQDSSSDDDLELLSLPLPPSYTQGRKDDRRVVSAAPAPTLPVPLASSPPDDPPLPTLPLPPNSNGGGATTLSRSSTTSSMSTTIVSATRATATAATEIPLPPAQNPQRPKLGGPQHSSPVLIKPLVLGETEDEKAFETMLRTVIIPNNRPTTLTDPLLHRPSVTPASPAAPEHIAASATQQVESVVHIDKDSTEDQDGRDGEGEKGAGRDQDHLLPASIVGSGQDAATNVKQATDCINTHLVPVHSQSSMAPLDTQDKLLKEDEGRHEDAREEIIVVTENQDPEVQEQNTVTVAAVDPKLDDDGDGAQAPTNELSVGEHVSCDAQSSILFHNKAQQVEKQAEAQVEESKEEGALAPTPPLPPAQVAEKKHKEIVIFGEDLIVEIAAPLWSGSEDEMEPKSPELTPTVATTTTAMLPQDPLTAIAHEPLEQLTAAMPDNTEVVSEPTTMLEAPVFVPGPSTIAVTGDQKLTIQPPGTQGAISLPIELPTVVDMPTCSSSSSTTATTTHMAVASPSRITFEQQQSSPPQSPTLPSPTHATTRSHRRRHRRRATSRQHREQQDFRRKQQQQRAALQQQQIEARKQRASPWVWHQEGYRHHRLESHQILTKEQVFERFHMELDEDGPNGFFLYKLVRRFKEPAQAVRKGSAAAVAAVAASAASKSSVASKESSASATTAKGKGDSSLENTSFARRLKRQLWLQKSKKEKKPNPSTGSNSSSSSSSSNNNNSSNSNSVNNSSAVPEEEDLKTFLMMNNNTSMSDLNSSLQEVIDAVDSLKRNSHLWVDDDPLFSVDHEGAASSSEESKVVYPQSDDEFAIRDKEHLVAHVAGLERRKGIYSTGRLDGLDLMPKKRFRALQRRSSSHRSMAAAANGGGSNSTSSSNRATANGSASSDVSGSAAATATTTTSMTSAQPQFKKQAVMQLHIYSRNGLKFKFDVMENDELHFVEASKKYTFMDPLPAHRQPILPSTLTQVQEQQEQSVQSLFNDDDNSLTRSLNTQRGIHPMYMTNRQLRSSMYINSNPSTASGSHNSFGTLSNTNKGKRLSIASTLTSNSSTAVPPGKRVFVTRLGRHTLLTYHEYKDLAKSPGFLTLGAKLLIQRNISSFKGSSSSSSSSLLTPTTPSFPPLSASTTDEVPLSPTFGPGGSGDDPAIMTTSPVSSSGPAASAGTSQSTPSSTPATTTTRAAEPTDYFSTPRRKSLGLPGFGSKSKSSSKGSSSLGKSSLTAALNAAAGVGPPTPSTPGTPGGGGGKATRAIVTPYNPNDYKTPTSPTSLSTLGNAVLTGSEGGPSSDAPKTASSPTAISGVTPIHIPGASSPPASSQQQQQQQPFATPMSPTSPTTSSTGPSSDSAIVAAAALSTSPGAVPIHIHKKGNQAGLKFHHLFTLVHQRLCKLELEGGVPLLGVGLVQWAPIVDPAELRWWRDTVGISAIGWIEGDDLLDDEEEAVEEEDEEGEYQDEFDCEDDEQDGSRYGAALDEPSRSGDSDEEDDEDEFFDIGSQFDDENENDMQPDLDTAFMTDQGPLGRPSATAEALAEEDQRDDDEDIYDRSIGRSPPNRSSSMMLLQRSLSNSTAATFQTARSRLHHHRQVAIAPLSPSSSSSASASSGPATPITTTSSRIPSKPKRKSSSTCSPPSLAPISPDASSSSTRPHPPRRQRSPHVKVERLGYRFVRVSGYMGVLKVTVSDKVEARAVALAIQAQAHVQQYHPMVAQCHLAGCDVSVGTATATATVATGPWEEGVEAIGLEPGEPLVERMSLIVAQARAFKGNYYIKTIKMFNKAQENLNK